jgi:hypothetical protein
MSDTVLTGFLFETADAAPGVERGSGILKFAPLPGTGDPPTAYVGALRGIEHFERGKDGTVHITDDPVPFTISFPADYLRSVDRTLQFRVARVNTPLFHPNCREDGTVCLGHQFQPGTPLRPLLERIYGIVSSRVIATDHAFDPRARDYFVAHTEEVRHLRERAPSLWVRPVAARVRIEEVDPASRPGHSEGRGGARP